MKRTIGLAGIVIAGCLYGCGTPATRPALSTYPGNGQQTIAWADLDGDGRLDLITAVRGVDCYKGCPDALARGTHIDSGYVELRFNNGRGQLHPPQAVAAGLWPAGVAPADVDGDGDLDLLVTDRYGDGVNVLLNTGGRHFRPGTKPRTGSMPENIVAGDLNGDGHSDFATVCVNTGVVSVGFGDGRGNFRVRHLHTAPGDDTHFIAFADVDHDHDLDLLALVNRIEQHDAVRVCYNDGHGRFGGSERVVDSAGQYQAVAVRGAGLRASQVVAVGEEAPRFTLGDIDGDGDLDLLATNYSDQAISFRRNDGRGNFESSPIGTELLVDAAVRPYYMTLADLDDDNDLDILTRAYGDSLVYIIFNEGPGQFSDARVPVPHWMDELRVADLDHDGRAELLLENGQRRELLPY